MRIIHRAIHVTVITTGVVSFHRAIDDRRIVHDCGVVDDHRLGDFSTAIVPGDGLLEARISIPAQLVSRDRSASIFLHDFFPSHLVSQIVFGPVQRSILFANFLALYSSGRGKALRMFAVRLFLHHFPALAGRSRLDIAAICGRLGL